MLFPLLGISLLCLHCQSELITLTEYKSVTIDPPEETCGYTGRQSVNYHYRDITCKAECPIVYAGRPNASYVAADMEMMLGYPNCSNTIYGPSGVSGPSVRRKRGDPNMWHRPKRQTQMVTSGCWYEGSSLDSYDYETYVMRIKPDPSIHNMVLLSRGQLNVQLRYNAEQQSFHIIFRRFYEPERTHDNWKLPAGEWSHLALYTSRTFQHSQQRISLFINGKPVSPTVLLPPAPSARRKRANRIGREEFRIGWDTSYRRDCTDNRIESCLAAGYDFSIDTSQQADQRFQFNAEVALMDLLKACPDVSEDLLSLFGCSVLLKPCGQLQRMPSLKLCEDVLQSCPEIARISAFTDHVQCSNYTATDVNGNRNIDVGYQPELETTKLIYGGDSSVRGDGGGRDCEVRADSTYTIPEHKTCKNCWHSKDLSPFRGEMNNFRIFYSGLTQRQIMQDYMNAAELPTNNKPYPQCMCDEAHPLLDKDISCQDLELNPDYVRVGRLNEGFSQPGYATLGHTDVGWLSAGNKEKFSLEVDLERKGQVFMVDFLIGNFMPPEMFLEGYRNGQWETLHYKKENCGDEKTDIVDAADVICEESSDSSVLDNIAPVSFNLLNGRPGWTPEEEDGGYDAGDGYDYYAVEPPKIPEDDSLTLELEEFLTVEKVRVRFEGFAAHSFPVISVSKFEARGWESYNCGCHPDGTVLGMKCDEETGQCPCRTEAQGNIPSTNVKCAPYIEPLYPGYGPVSGGTDLFIWGGFFGDGNVTVQLGNSDLFFKVNVKNSNETFIHCLSPIMNTTENLEKYLNQKVSLTITLASGSKIISNKSSHQFTYKPDPVISEIRPLHSFLLGGIQQTIIGENLDSVAHPVMSVTLFYISTFFPNENKVCTVENSTTMYCPTPYIELPAVAAGPGRKRRELEEEETFPQDNVHHRYARQTRYITGEINRDYRQFYIGFKLDGVPTYTNVSEVLPEYGIIHIFENPEIFEFDPEIQPFKPYKGESMITIKGEHLSYGCSLEDYTVAVGKEVCINIPPLFDNQLTCTPPDNEPKDEFAVEGAPRVTIRVGNIHLTMGFLQYYNSDLEIASIRNTIIAMVVIVSVILLILVVFVVWYKTLKDKYPLPRRIESLIGIKRASANVYCNPTLMDKLNAELRETITACLIDEKRMEIGKQVGSGNFGKVHIGTLAEADDSSKVDIVAIKTLKDESEGLQELSEFLNEGTIMKDFDHKNVLCLLGVAIRDDRPFVLLPYMDKGDLRKYVSDPINAFSVRLLVELCHQVCKGMAYLASLKFVHRDLAARNCMVDSDNLVKIADFGLARDIYEKDYYRTEDRARPLPVKWMAIESLEAQTFTSKSDVWSFGVVIWEVISRGVKPYPDIDNRDLKKYLKLGRRLERPDYCPDKVYELMQMCWQFFPDERPSFDQLEMDLDGLLNEANCRTPGAAAAEEYDDVMVGAASNYDPEDAEVRDYLALVPHPTVKYERPESTDSSSGLLPGISHPLDLGYDKVKPKPAQIENVREDPPTDSVKFVKNESVESGYLVPIRDPDTEEGGGYTIPVRQSHEAQYNNNDYIAPKSNKEVPMTVSPNDVDPLIGEKETFDENPLYAKSPQKESLPPNVPLEGYLPMDKITPTNSPKPKPKPKPSPRPDTKIRPIPSPKPSPRPSQKPSPKPSPKPKEKTPDSLSLAVPKPQPSPKPPKDSLDEQIPARIPVEGYLAMGGAGKKPEPTPQFGEPYMDMHRSQSQDSDGYLAPVQQQKGDGYMAPVAQDKDADYLRPLTITKQTANPKHDPDYDNRKSTA